jgi:ribosomal protein S27E
MNITEHPQFAALCEVAPLEQQQHFALEDCPGCGKKLKKLGGYVTITEPPFLAMSIVCPTCARRIQNSPGQREKIMDAIHQTVRLAVECGGHS